eukprot:6868021-Prymnesium_polylepis.2
MSMDHRRTYSIPRPTNETLPLPSGSLSAFSLSTTSTSKSTISKMGTARKAGSKTFMAGSSGYALVTIDATSEKKIESCAICASRSSLGCSYGAKVQYAPCEQDIEQREASEVWETDDEAKNQLPSRTTREEDGQGNEGNLACALEDLEPECAQLVSGGQLAKVSGKLRTYPLELCADFSIHGICLANSLFRFFLAVGAFCVQLGQCILRLNRCLQEPQLSQLCAVSVEHRRVLQRDPKRVDRHHDDRVRHERIVKGRPNLDGPVGAHHGKGNFAGPVECLGHEEAEDGRGDARVHQKTDEETEVGHEISNHQGRRLLGGVMWPLD